MLSVVLTLCAAAQAQPWNVRPVMPATNPAHNIDVLLPGPDQAIVGYALPNGGGSGTGFLSAVGVNALSHQMLPSAAETGSFGIDAFGAVSYATFQSPAPRLIVGNDLGAFGGIVDSPHPDTQKVSLGGSVVYALDNHGIPALAYRDNLAQRRLSRFDTQTGQWQTHTVGDFGLIGLVLPPQALAFDADNRPIVGYVSGGQSNQLVIARESPVFGWQDLSNGIFSPFGPGISIATAPTGEIAFAYSNTDAVFVGIYDGVSTTIETVGIGRSFLTPHSLAYDSTTGDFALAYVEDFDAGFEPVHIARRVGTDNWTNDLIGIDAALASLTFDEAGNAYIGAATDGYVTLITDNPALALLLGDANNDGQVTGADLIAVQQNFGNVGPADGLLLGDANNDGQVTGADLISVQQNFGNVLSAASANVPEPTMVMLMLVGGCVGSLRSTRTHAG